MPRVAAGAVIGERVGVPEPAPTAAPRGAGRPGWAVTWERGTAADFHGRPIPGRPGRSVQVLEVEGPALVLGSTQLDTDADRSALARAGVELVRRRSGGGAVLLEPGSSLWVDVVLPRDDPLWSEDVGVAFHWLGRAWVAALRSLGLPAAVHEGALVTTRWSRLVCFAGLGPGEVTVRSAKVVGIAQRRTRDGARFQCALLHRWDPAATLALLALPDGERAEAAAALAGAAGGVDRAAAAIVGALVAHLPP